MRSFAIIPEFVIFSEYKICGVILKRFLFKITMLLFILLLIYALTAFTGCVIEISTPKMKITQASVTGFDYYIIATDPDLFFDEIEKINKKRLVPYFIDKKPVEQTVKLFYFFNFFKKQSIQ